MYPLAPVRRMSRLLEGEEDIWGHYQTPA